MKIAYRTTNFRGAARNKIDAMNEIIAEYQDQDLRLTARQLYYQFVSRDLVPNLPAEYKKLTSLLTDARYAGLVDWDAIEDRGREPNTPSEWKDLKALTESALRSYRLPRWEGQSSYVELWVEKQALAGVLEPLARTYHATLMVNKGYSSASAMKESADRIISSAVDPDGLADLKEIASVEGRASGLYEDTCVRVWENGLDCHILYLGDHDPSGEDMVRDIETRLREFGVNNLAVKKVALTTAQVKQYKPPPNPAKLTDPRAGAYIEKFGDKSWEVDALPPNVLASLIEDAFERLIDKKKMNAVKLKEESDKERLRKAVDRIQ